jgi:hypothetical protein
MARLGSTTTKRAREMRRVLARWARSGLTQREFADREGIAASTIAWWGHVFRHAGKRPHRAPKRRRPQRRSRQGATPAFIEVKMGSVTPAQVVPLEIVVRTGQVIRVPAHFDAVSLRAVIAALEVAC